MSEPKLKISTLFAFVSISGSFPFVNGQTGAATAGGEGPLPGVWPRPDTPPNPVASWTNQYYRNNTKVLDIIKSCNRQDEWAITFDDGPSKETPRVLAILKKHNLKATFFVSGSRVVQNPGILKQIYAEGHQIAMHTWAHTALTKLTDEQIITDIAWNMRAIKTAIDVVPRYMRPPEGAIDARVQKVLSMMGVQAVMWTKDTEDWRITTNGDAFGQSVVEKVKSWKNEPRTTGQISLHHDILPRPVNFAEPIIEALLQTGAQFKTVSACLGTTMYAGQKLPSGSNSLPQTQKKVETKDQMPPQKSSASIFHPSHILILVLGTFLSLF